MNHEELVASVQDHFFRIGRCVRRYATLDEGSGLADVSLLQMQALHYILAAEKPTVKDLAEEFNVSAASASLLADRLANLELIDRTHQEDDRRKVTLGITPKGDEVLQAAKRYKTEGFKEMLSTLTTEELTQFDSILGKMESAALSINNKPKE